MYFSTSSTFFICFLITQHIIGVSCAGHLGTVDYVAIGTSLGIAVFLLIFIAFFLWRAQKNPQGTFGGRAEMGTDNLGIKAEEVRIQTISMTPLPQDNGH